MTPISCPRESRQRVFVSRVLPLVFAVLIGACAGQREIPPDTPQWVREGSGPAIADGTQYLYGVGVVGKMKSRVLMRAAADNKAKNKLGRAVDAYVEGLMAAYGASSRATGDAEARVRAHQELRAVAAATLPTAVVSDHWQDAESGNYFALCRLELSRLLERIALARILPESLRRFTLEEGALVFDRQRLRTEP